MYGSHLKFKFIAENMLMRYKSLKRLEEPQALVFNQSKQRWWPSLGWVFNVTYKDFFKKVYSKRCNKIQNRPECRHCELLA